MVEFTPLQFLGNEAFLTMPTSYSGAMSGQYSRIRLNDPSVGEATVRLEAGDLGSYFLKAGEDYTISTGQ
jgi:hypothetical protein